MSGPVSLPVHPLMRPRAPACLESRMSDARPTSALRFGALAVSLALAVGSGLAFAPLQASAARPAKAAGVDIAYQQFTLPNGLRVIVHLSLIHI